MEDKAVQGFRDGIKTLVHRAYKNSNPGKKVVSSVGAVKHTDEVYISEAYISEISDFLGNT